MAKQPLTMAKCWSIDGKYLVGMVTYEGLIARLIMVDYESLPRLLAMVKQCDWWGLEGTIGTARRVRTTWQLVVLINFVGVCIHSHFFEY